jgi:hypothetical protein
LAIDKQGRKEHQAPLPSALDHLHDGDVLVGPSVYWLARNLEDLRKIVTDLTGRGLVVSSSSYLRAIRTIPTRAISTPTGQT